MALSASESALLAETCTNMNVAANTCREVLEMLRSLGNTGVVDIATHNNAQGRHADDKTLLHASVGSSYIQYNFNNGINDFTCTTASYNEKTISIEGKTKTFGNTSAGVGKITEINSHTLTDSSGTGVSFANFTQNGILALNYKLERLVDGTDSTKTASSGIRYYASRSSIFGDESKINPYGTIGFMVTQGTYGSVPDVLLLTYPALYPAASNVLSLGLSGKAFKDLYLVNAVTVTSDRRAKKDVASIGSQAVDFIKALRPVAYKLKQGEGHIDPVDENGNPIPVENPPADREGIRTHWGLIAQEVKEALSTAGYEDAALWCLADKNDPDSQQSLRYEELIAPLIKVVQQQQERIEALERKVA